LEKEGAAAAARRRQRGGGSAGRLARRKKQFSVEARFYRIKFNGEWREGRPDKKASLEVVEIKESSRRRWNSRAERFERAVDSPWGTPAQTHRATAASQHAAMLPRSLSLSLSRNHALYVLFPTGWL